MLTILLSIDSAEGMVVLLVALLEVASTLKLLLLILYINHSVIYCFSGGDGGSTGGASGGDIYIEAVTAHIIY